MPPPVSVWSATISTGLWPRARITSPFPTSWSTTASRCRSLWTTSAASRVCSSPLHSPTASWTLMGTRRRSSRWTAIIIEAEAGEYQIYHFYLSWRADRQGHVTALRRHPGDRRTRGDRGDDLDSRPDDEGLNLLLLFTFYRNYFRALQDRVFKCPTYSPGYIIE